MELEKTAQHGLQFRHPLVFGVRMNRTICLVFVYEPEHGPNTTTE